VWFYIKNYKSKRKEEIKVNNMFEEMGKANIRAFCDKLM